MKRLKSAMQPNERGLDIQTGLSQIDIQPFVPLKQYNICDDSNYTVKKIKSTSKTSNILYDLLMKYNGFYKEQELDQVPEPEAESFKIEIEEAHTIANENYLIRATLLEMELAIKQAI